MSNKKGFVLILGLYILILFQSQEYIFFGDMVQFGSRHAHFFYENNFSNYWLPTEMDSGHPPIFGMYIAFIWKIFGKTLTASHWAMLPFLCIIAYSVNHLLSKITQHNTIVACSLFVLEPTLRAQSMLTSPDIVLAAFFLLSIYLFHAKKPLALSFALIPISLISMRGMIVLFALFISFIIYNYKIERKPLLKSIKEIIIIFFIPSALAGTWLILHYLKTGWIGVHSSSPWSSSFENVGILGVFKNVFILVWRWIDFGRISVLILLVFFIISQYKTRIISPIHHLFIIILITCTIMLSALTLFSDGLIGHRYYIPIYLTALFYLISYIENSRELIRKYAYLIVAISFIVGSTFVYPVKISMGWDSSPAHRPYYTLRKSSIMYLNEHGIKLNNVAAGFPTLDKVKLLELNEDESSFVSYSDSGFSYILYSNIFNYPDYIINNLESKEPVYSSSKSNVFMNIYKIDYKELSKNPK